MRSAQKSSSAVLLCARRGSVNVISVVDIFFQETLKMLKLKKLLGLLAVLSLGLSLAQAQNQASVTGQVTDTTGAVIPGTVVSLTDPGKGLDYKQTTNGQGSYRFVNILPDPGYVLTFSHDGFATYVIKGVELQVGKTRTQNAELKAASASVQVEVSASNQEVTLDTTDASIGNNVDVRQMNDLPVLDRTAGISALFTLEPGVDSFSGAVTGARIDQSSVTLDGLDVNDLATGEAFAIVANAPVDSVQQFNGTVAGLVPSVGTGSGGQFQLVTRSGSNQFHGNINEYHRDTATAANTWFNNNTKLPRTPLIRNQFGGNVGGPVLRDKLYFFFDAAISRIVQSQAASRTVPLDSYLAGNLNYINNNTGCTSSSRQNTTPGCISTLSSAQVAAIDPNGVGFNSNLLSFLNSRYPHANDLTLGDGVNTGGYRFNYSTPDNEATYVGRIDYNLNAHHKIFGRFTINRRDSVESLPEFGTDPSTHPFQDRSYSYVVSDVWTIGNNKVNEFYYGDTISKYNFPDIYNPTGANQYAISGLSGPYTSFDGQKRRVPIPEVRDDFNWQRGSHSLTIGGTFKFVKTDSNLINNFNFPDIGDQGPPFSQYADPSKPATAALFPSNILNDYAGSATAVGDYYSSLTSGLGILSTISTNYNYDNTGAAQPAGSGGPRAYRFFQTEAYVGDTWKVTPHLTLSYGLRYQLYSVPYEAHGEESTPVDNATGNPITMDQYVKDRLVQSAANDTSPTGLPFYKIVLAGKANKGPNLYDPSYKDFAPRVAFAYNPAYSPKTVIDGSAALVYDRSVINAINFLQDQISYLFSNSNINNITEGEDPVGAFKVAPRVGSNLSYDSSLNPAPIPVAPGLVPFVDPDAGPYGLAYGETNFVISPNLKDPYSIALNLGIQQEFPNHFIFKMNYVGRLGRRLLADADAGQVIDYPDKTSGQLMSQAFANLTRELRANQTITAQPWFENVIGPGGTAYVVDNAGTYVKRGDLSDAIYLISAPFGALPFNVGIPSQFGANAYLTNQGNSNYHALLLTLDRNFSQGLRFQVNYTWSHAIDNTSLSANNNSLFSNSGFICDLLNPRACRATSDFDVNQEVNGYVTYELPFGHHRAFASNTPRIVDEFIGGWALSALPKYRTGLAVTPYSDAYLASFDNQDPAIFTGNPGDLRVSVNKQGSTVFGFKGGSAGASKVLSEFRGPIGLEYGQRNLVRGPGGAYLDTGLQKVFPIIENKVNLQFRADFFNLFNHPVFGTPALNIVGNASQFGQITSTQGNDAGTIPQDNQRIGQFSLRIDF
jgi:hypothetical protein